MNDIRMLRLGRQSSSRRTQGEACLSSRPSAWPLPRSSLARGPTDAAPAVLADTPFSGTGSARLRICCGRRVVESQKVVGRKSLPPASVLGYSRRRLGTVDRRLDLPECRKCRKSPCGASPRRDSKTPDSVPSGLAGTACRSRISRRHGAWKFAGGGCGNCVHALARKT